MASEVRVNQIQNRSGLSTVTFSDSGVSIAGVTTVGILSATGNSVFSGNVTASGFTGALTGNVTGNATGLSGTPNITVNQINASGVVTATSFSGSGANLTGIGGTTDVRTNSLVVSGVSTITTLNATSIVGVTTAGITTAYIGSIRNTSGVDITPRIIQVVTSKWDTTSNGSAYIVSGTYTDSGASASITPKINGSTIIITVNGRLGSSYSSYIDHYWIIKDNAGNNLPGYTNALQYIETLNTGSGLSYMFMQAYHENVSGAQTYKLYGAQVGGNGVYIHQPVIFTLMEVMV